MLFVNQFRIRLTTYDAAIAFAQWCRSAVAAEVAPRREEVKQRQDKKRGALSLSAPVRSNPPAQPIVRVSIDLPSLNCGERRVMSSTRTHTAAAVEGSRLGGRDAHWARTDDRAWRRKAAHACV